MLARTEMMNAGRVSYDNKMSDEGFDIVELGFSGNACKYCAAYEGRLFSLTGNNPQYPSKADLIRAKVFHPNCTHTYTLVSERIQKRDYNPNGTRKNKTGTIEQPSTNSTERFSNGTIMVINNNGSYPNNKKYNVLKSCYQSALKNPNDFLEKARLRGIETKREFCASYDKDGNLFAVSCGKANTGDASIKYPYPNGKVYHNHTTESSFSATDIEMFIMGELQEMTLITPKKVKYHLTFKQNGAKLNKEKITSKYENARKKHNDDFNEIWKEVFNETDYEYKIL